MLLLPQPALRGTKRMQEGHWHGDGEVSCHFEEMLRQSCCFGFPGPA